MGLALSYASVRLCEKRKGSTEVDRKNRLRFVGS